MKKAIILILAAMGMSINSHANKALPPACPSIQVTGSDASCYGVSDGSATVVITAGGSGNYTHTWSNGTPGSGNTSTINLLSSGTYTVTVRDNVSGCAVTSAYVVDEPDPISISGTVTDINCFGDTTGAVNVNVSGGGSSYNFEWENASNNVVATTQNLSDASAGSYTLTVLAPNAACSLSQTFVIEQPTEELNSSAIVSNTNCFNENSGSIDVSVWGGTPPYSFVWGGGQSTEDLNNLNSGGYTLTITDNKGCTRTETYNISQPALLTGVMSSTDVLCFGDATGSVGVVASGGTAPYSYSWQNSQTVFAANSSSLTNVIADGYQVTVTDNNGCTFVGSTVVNEPTLLDATAAVTDVNCFGGTDGEIDLTVTGGVGPYDYLWTNSVPNNVGVTEDLIGIPADEYSVVVTDDNGCTVSLSEIVSQPVLPINVSVSFENVLCHGDNTGSIDLTVSGGTPNYIYSWTSGQTTEDINNLLAGTYGYTVIDNNNCIETGNVIITQPSQPLSVTSIIDDVNCFGESNGAIDLSVSGGTPNYSFQWSNSSFLLSNTTEDLTNIPADDYRFEVTDDNGCNVVDTVTVNEPPLLASTITGVNILCKGESTGEVDLTVTGGVTPYTYAWNNGLITQDLSNLPAGVYDVVVTDFNGCETTNSIELIEPSDSLSFTFTVEDVTCNDGTDGEISLSLAGGTQPYDLDWSNGDTLQLLTDLVAGTYIFDVVDNNGCEIGDTIIVDQPDPITLNDTITHVSCYGLSDGAINISPTGGTAPYDFTWFNSDFALSAQTEDLVDFPAEVYQLEIVDSNGCFYEQFLEIEQPDSIIVEYTFNIVSCSGGNDASIDVTVTGGTPAYDFLWSTGDTTEDLIGIPAGQYALDITDQNGCQDSLEVEITQPDSITVSFKTTLVSCVDQFDGTAIATAQGGNGGFEYYWENGTVGAFAEQLSNDWHSIQVFDILGCEHTDSVFIDINPKACIDPVNTFTPNGDDYNDTWVIDNMELYPNLFMQIFNKWGNLIKTYENEYIPWDGTHNGNELPAGVYYWTLYLNNDNNDILRGNITIIK